MSNFNGTFNRDDPKYRCCCSSMHIETGAVVLTCLQAFSVSSSLSLLLVHTSAQQITSLVCGVFISACLFLAIKTKNKYYLIPHMIIMIVFIIFSALILLPLVFVFVQPVGEAVWIILLIAFLGIAILILGIWDLIVVRKYYNYLDDMELHLRTTGGYNDV